MIVSDNMKRLQCLFEHACEQIMKNSGRHWLMAKNADGTYKAKSTEDLFTLWLAGHSQGVADHAVARGDVEL